MSEAEREAVGVVLAAGASRRAGGAKALWRIQGVPLVLRAIETLLQGGCSEVVVVVAAPHGQRIVQAVGERARVVWNAEPERGMLSSVQLGAEAAPGARCVVISLVDHPLVHPTTVARLLEAWRASTAQWVRPLVEGRHGHPHLVDAAVLPGLRRAAPTDTLRSVLERTSSKHDVALEDAAVLSDLDTAEELMSAGVEP